MKTHRQKLEEVGGYENDMVGIPARGVQPIIDDLEETQRKLLSLLVMDLGYGESPVYGHDPIRHRLAWDFAVSGLNIDVLGQLVRDMENQRDLEEAAIKA